ncbi:unnamed protein product [Lota lota]
MLGCLHYCHSPSQQDESASASKCRTHASRLLAQPSRERESRSKRRARHQQQQKEVNVKGGLARRKSPTSWIRGQCNSVFDAWALGGSFGPVVSVVLD